MRRFITWGILGKISGLGGPSCGRWCAAWGIRGLTRFCAVSRLLSSFWRGCRGRSWISIGRILVSVGNGVSASPSSDSSPDSQPTPSDPTSPPTSSSSNSYPGCSALSRPAGQADWRCTWVSVYSLGNGHYDRRRCCRTELVWGVYGWAAAFVGGCVVAGGCGVFQMAAAVGH